MSPLGGGSYAINGIPSGIEGLNPVELVRNMVHTAMEKGNDVKEEVQTILASTLARAAAIVYGQVLSNEEMSNLVDNLFACPSPNYTPDGKTVLATIKEDDIEKLFSNKEEYFLLHQGKKSTNIQNLLVLLALIRQFE